ncbi:hypothetical protein [Pyxidicoccus xibeiensis]|uniref:hypothetical protein n=1 Tax=Pyxidicoccus xibeiensis TaxID=2906759 RepID=UPI0020A80AB6|nr:hypothetical protein [Pyxidicoccus xibeiensis]MCP3142936.1 hypothetical protein [Pyxidicoccus xibeiensis]
MSWEFGYQEVASGDTATFDFSGDVALALYGISRFDITFDIDATVIGLVGSSISGFGVQLTRENAGEDSRRQVKVKATVTGTPITASRVGVTVLAWVGGASSTRFIVSSSGLATGEMSQPQSVVAWPAFASAVLTGFKLAYTSGSHDVSGVGASAGVAASITTPGAAYVTGAATLTGDGASGCTVDPSGLVLADAEEGAWFGLVSDEAQYEVDDTNWGTRRLRVETGAPVPLKGAVVLLQSFFGRFKATASEPVPVYSVSMGAGVPVLSAENGVFEFDSTRWLTNIYIDTAVGKTYYDPAQTYSAVYLWAAL